MKIAVCIKQVPDTESVLRIAPSSSTIIEDDIQWVINPHDETAVEQALCLKEEVGGTVTVVSLGPARIEKAIREALAMGADNAVRLHCETVPTDAASVARALCRVLHGYDLVLTGDEAIDGANAQVPQRVGTRLGLACVTAVEELHIAGTECRARRVLEGREEIARFSLPAVIGVNRRLKEPRYRTIRGLMQAKRKIIDIRQAEFDTDAIETLKLNPPKRKSGGRRFAFDTPVARVMARILRDEVKVI